MCVFRYSSFLIVILLIALLPGRVKADHYVYVTDNPIWQQSDPYYLPENFGFSRWYIYSTFGPGWESNRTLNWNASDSQVHGWFSTAVNEWQAVIDTYLDLDWHEWNDISSLNPKPVIHLDAIKANCPTSSTARACFVPNTFTTVNPGKARFWGTSKIYLNTTPPAGTSFATGYLAAALMHEIGHAYGLDEQYLHPLACNNSTTSIMDAGVVIGQVVQHCDGNAVQVDDRIRISQGYLGGNYEATLTYGSGNNIISEWKDKAWHDSWMWMNYYRWNGFWYDYKGTQNSFGTDLAAHKNIANRTIHVSYNVKSQWGSGYYKLCNYPWVGQTDASNNVVATGTCVTNIVVP